MDTQKKTLRLLDTENWCLSKGRQVREWVKLIKRINSTLIMSTEKCIELFHHHVVQLKLTLQLTEVNYMLTTLELNRER